MNALTPRSVAFTCCLLCMACAGCTPANPRPSVEGTVSYRGAPVGNQTLVLHQPAAKFDDIVNHPLRIQPDGSFKGDVPAPGLYRIVIDPPLEGKPVDVVNIPEKYRSATATDLTWEIGPGVNKKDIILTE